PPIASALEVALSDGAALLHGGNDEGAVRFAADRILRRRPTPGVGKFTAARAMPSARSGHATVAYADHLYIIGGDSGTATLADVQVTSIAPDGTLGEWKATKPLPAPRSRHRAVAWGG